MFKEILNIIISVSYLSGLIIYTQYHIVNYWDKKYYYIPILTIFIKLIFVIFFYFYTSVDSIHDANVYFMRPLDFYPFALGNHSLFIFGYFIREYLHLSYFNANLLLSVLPFIGLFLLLKCASKIYTVNHKLKNYHYVYILFFFPSFHFWCIGFAKETFVIFSVSLFCYKIFQGKIINYKNIFLILIPILFIRPHYIIFLFTAIFIFNFLITKNKKKNLIKFTPILLIGIYTFVASMNLIDNNIVSLNDFKNFIELRQQENIGQRINFNISDNNYLQLIFRFIYFPNLFNIFDIESLPILIILIIENSILLFFSGVFIYDTYKTKNVLNKKSIFVLLFLIIFFAFSASIVTSNFGITLRYKTFLYPIFITMFLLISKRENNLQFKKN